ncbi:MAG: SDR family oxidoreductase [Pseudomonadota bacterium]
METSQTIALVTGASRGLGYATALELARRGHHVIGLARTSGGLEDLADEIEALGGTSTLVPLDLTDDEGLARMGRAIFDRWGRLDLLVHAAAHAAPCAPVAQSSEKDLDKSFAVNARATQRLIVMCDPLLQAAANGHMIYVTDHHAGDKFFGNYGASKAAGQAIVESWAAENEGLKIKVDLFTPDPMPTATRARFYPGEDASKLAPTAQEAARLATLLD